MTARPERKNRNARYSFFPGLALQTTKLRSADVSKNLARAREVTMVNARTHGSLVRPEKSAIYIY